MISPQLRWTWCAASPARLLAASTCRCYDPVALARWTWRLTPVLAHRYGHRRVQELLRHEPLPPSMAPCDPLCFQVSSMASIQPKRLAGLKASFGAHAPATGTAEQQPDPQSDAEAPEVQFVYPTVAQVRDCIEGWFAGTSAAILGGRTPGALLVRTVGIDDRCPTAGLSLPCSSSCLTSSVRSRLHVYNCGRSGRWNVAPHIKTFCRYNPRAGSAELAWVILSSHNVSQAAWGSDHKDGSLHMASYELGVMHRPSKVPSRDGSQAKGALVHLFMCMSRNFEVPRVPSLDPAAHPLPVDPHRPAFPCPVLFVPLPHELPPAKYSPRDEPWAWDVAHKGEAQRDSKGGEYHVRHGARSGVYMTRGELDGTSMPAPW